MELECKNCGRKFHSMSEEIEQCQSCAEEEFSTATLLKKELNDETKEEILAARSRAKQRALQMQEKYLEGHNFSMASRVRFSIGVAILLICIVAFGCNDPNSNHPNALLKLEDDTMRIFCLILCITSSIFIITSSRKCKILRYAISVTIISCAWFSPQLKQAMQISAKFVVAKVDANEPTNIDIEAHSDGKNSSGSLLEQSDISDFASKQPQDGSSFNYAIFINNADPLLRTPIRDAIERILRARSTVAYSRGNGFLFISTGISGKARDITSFAKRFGQILHSDLDIGLYEVEYNAVTARIVNRYSSEIVSTETHPSYIYANIEELHSMCPQRVEFAAGVLNSLDAPILRIDIVNSLQSVLEDSWVEYPSCYKKLIQALTTYSSPENEKSVDFSLKYFKYCLARQQDINDQIIEYLIHAAPEKICDDIIKEWCINPIRWTSALEQLGERAQNTLLELLCKSNADHPEDLQQVSNIITHLKNYGSASAIPELERFRSCKDSLIQQSSETAIKSIINR